MTIYSAGSAAVVSGSSVVVGTNTTWALSEVAGGLFTMNGVAIPIASVESNTQLTLRYRWSASSRVGAYAISLASAQAATSVAILRRIQENVTALRNLSPLGRAVTSAETTEALRQLIGISAGRFQVDASGLFAERAQYDDRPPAFSFLATDQGLIYLREGASGWSEGLVFGKGDDGREIELRADDARIEWRYEGEFDWRGLVDIDLLKGADGREVEFGQSATHLQWRLVGEGAWLDLVPLSLITGPQGDEAVSTREAKEAAAAALVSETAAKASEEAADLSEAAAKVSETAAAASASAATDARTGAESARDAAVDARTGAEAAEIDAREHRSAASASASGASASEEAAAESAASAALARDEAAAARSGAETALDASITAKEGAEDAATVSAQARDGAVAAQGGAEGAEASAKLAQSASEAARGEAVAAADAADLSAQFSSDAEVAASTARDGAVSARGAAVAAAGDAEGSALQAGQARDLAVSAREGAEGAEAGAVEARGGAEAARDAAAQSAADAALFDPTSYYTKDEIDARPVPSGDWADIEGKPDIFPPAPHDHDGRYYTKAEIDARPVPDTSWDGITGKPVAFPATTHQHSLADVNGLEAALDQKAGLVDGKLPSELLPSIALAIAYDARSANTQIVVADQAKLIDLQGTFTQTFASPAALGNSWWCEVRNNDQGQIEIPEADGRTNWLMLPGEHRRFFVAQGMLLSIVLSPFRLRRTASTIIRLPPGYKSLGFILRGAGGGGAKLPNPASNQITGAIGGRRGSAWLVENVSADALGDEIEITVGAGGTGQTGSGAGNAGAPTSVRSGTFQFTALGGAGGPISSNPGAGLLTLEPLFSVTARAYASSHGGSVTSINGSRSLRNDYDSEVESLGFKGGGGSFLASGEDGYGIGAGGGGTFDGPRGGNGGGGDVIVWGNI